MPNFFLACSIIIIMQCDRVFVPDFQAHLHVCQRTAMPCHRFRRSFSLILIYSWTFFQVEKFFCFFLFHCCCCVPCSVVLRVCVCVCMLLMVRVSVLSFKLRLVYCYIGRDVIAPFVRMRSDLLSYVVKCILMWVVHFHSWCASSFFIRPGYVSHLD